MSATSGSMDERGCLLALRLREGAVCPFICCDGHQTMVHPQPENRRQHSLTVEYYPHLRASLVDPNRRYLYDLEPASLRGEQQVDVENEIARRQKRYDALYCFSSHHLRAALSVEKRQLENSANGGRKDAACEAPRTRSVAGDHRGGVTTTGDGSVGVLGRGDQTLELVWRCRPIGIDERDDVTRRASESLHDDATLSQLGKFVVSDARILGRAASDDACRRISTSIERNVKSDIGVRERKEVGVESATDAVLLIVGGDHDVQCHGASSGWWGLEYHCCAFRLCGDKPKRIRTATSS